MSIVVDHTLPFSAAALKLDDASRWHKLLPLLRPSLSISKQRTESILIDSSLRNSANVQIAVIGSIGHITSKVLSSNSIAAIASDSFGAAHSSAADVLEALKAKGVDCRNGLVVVRSGNRQVLKVDEGLGIAVVEVELASELKVDHVLSLLLSCNEETRSNWGKMTEMLKQFLKSGAETSSFFQVKKCGEKPSVIHTLDVSSFNSAKLAVERDLSQLLDSQPTSANDNSKIYSVHFADLNGLARLEKDILAHEISEFFEKQEIPCFITQSSIVSSHSTARGWSISICTIPATYISAQAKPKPAFKSQTHKSSGTPLSTSSKIQFSDPEVRKRIVAACEAVIEDEPTITEYDTMVGDGDCGYTLRDGAKKVLSFIESQDLTALHTSLASLVDELEVSMGGTSGALYCIFLSSLAQALTTKASFPEALQEAKESLCKYTSARVGDRTMMDCLIPFVDTWVSSFDLSKALSEAEKGVTGTEKMNAKLGRSSYLDENATRGVPDPGAYGLLVLLKGMVDT